MTSITFRSFRDALRTCALVTAFMFAQESCLAAPPFLIAPMIEGVGLCQEGAVKTNVVEALATCDMHPSADFGAHAIKMALEKLEPGGARGDVQVGYTLGMNVFTLYFEKPEQYLARIRKLIEAVPRPVVIYFMANQFAYPPVGVVPPVDSFMHFADQTIPDGTYFGGHLPAWTLSTDSSLTLNQVRLAGIKRLGKWYRKLPAQTRTKIRAITLAGELHHFFPDFSGGMGKFENIRVTDYSPTAKKAFQAWLKGQFGTIKRLNATAGTNFSSFTEIEPPGSDIRKGQLEFFEQHYDAYAHGLVPISGWFHTEDSRPTIQIYLNGVLHGTAEDGLNRQDVYESVAETPHARVGFRYWLDFSRLAKGIHTVQVTGRNSLGEFELAQRQIVVMDKQQSPPQKHPISPTAFGTAPKNWQYWLDHPRNLLDLYFNPLARQWNAFRAHQVKHALTEWFNQAVASGLPAKKLYSHQIAVATMGSWNPILFASDESLQGPTPYRKGINAYGGSASVDLLKRYYLRPGEHFAVPEFHPQAWKGPQGSLNAIDTLYHAGADFITPYFVSIYPDKFRTPGNAHDKFRIAPENADYGSNHFYTAIVKMARH